MGVRRVRAFSVSVAASLKKGIMKTGKAQTNRGSILIIDDDESLAAVLAVLLTRNGFSIWVAPTGKEGLHLAEQYCSDLILSDIDLPDLDGFEICRRLKASSKLKNVPVILMSGRHPEDGEKKALGVGAVDYLSKPFPTEGLAERLAAHIKNGGGNVL
jgi:two-component system sensor histidine kinase/response regulator